MLNIKELPYTTVEQVLRFRTEAIKQIDELTLENIKLKKDNRSLSDTVEILQGEPHC